MAYPVTVLIEGLFEKQMKVIEKNIEPCPFQLELLASLERLLCYCHTGNTTVFATTLMNQLGLSRGALIDGFPVLHPIFQHPTLLSAMNSGFIVDPRRWPKNLKDNYPAIASKKTQMLTYSLSHFMASDVARFAASPPFLTSFLSHIKLYSESGSRRQ